MKLFITILLFVLVNIAFAGKLQNEDFKTESELISAGGSAAQLLNDSKIYITAGSINKTFDDAITDGDIGGDYYRLIDADNDTAITVEDTEDVDIDIIRFLISSVEMATIDSASMTFNSSYQDADFYINKNTSGVAYGYDAGLDNHSFNSPVSISSNTDITGDLDVTGSGSFTGNVIIDNLTAGNISQSELNNLDGIVGISTGVADNDKIVTQGYVDDSKPTGTSTYVGYFGGDTFLTGSSGLTFDDAGLDVVGSGTFTSNVVVSGNLTAGNITQDEFNLLDGIVSVSTGTLNNDKFVTQGYVDDFVGGSTSLTTDVSGILPIANGGTNSSAALGNDKVMISSAGAIVESADISTTELGLLNGILSVSTGSGDNDKFVTQGYVDDAKPTGTSTYVGFFGADSILTGSPSLTFDSTGLDVTGSATFTQGISVGALSNFAGNLQVNSDLDVTGSSTLTGNAYAESGLYVKQLGSDMSALSGYSGYYSKSDNPYFVDSLGNVSILENNTMAHFVQTPSSPTGFPVIYSAYITNSGSASISREYGAWLNSASRTALGQTTLNLTSGACDNTPNCFVSAIHVTASRVAQLRTVSTSTITVLTENTNTGGDSDENYFIICHCDNNI